MENTCLQRNQLLKRVMMITIVAVSVMIMKDNMGPIKKIKRLIKHPLMYQSREFQGMIESLDRKLERRRTSRSKAMCLPIEIGSPSTRKKPSGIPEWACELLD